MKTLKKNKVWPIRYEPEMKQFFSSRESYVKILATQLHWYMRRRKGLDLRNIGKTICLVYERHITFL